MAPPADAATDTVMDAVTDAVTDAARTDATPDAPRPSGPAAVTVTRYEYAIDLTTRAVTATLSLFVTRPGDCVTVGFRHPTADEVRFGDAPARAVVVENGTLTACDPTGRGWSVSDTLSLTVRSTEPSDTLRPTQVGFSTRNSMSGGRFTYLLSWVGECARHGPCDVSPATFATYRFRVTHPAGTEVFCPGERTAGMTETVCDLAVRAPTYSAMGVLAMTNGWRHTSLGTAPGVSIELYDTAQSGISAMIDRPNLTAYVSWLIERFGAFPFGRELRMVVAPTYWAGFEHPGTIALAESLGGGGRLDHTIRHEIAHQWAGDQTTLASSRDFVWKEAAAEYLAYVYEDEHPALSEEARASLENWHTAAGVTQYRPMPDDDTALVTYYGSVYGAGPMILFRQLETMFSRANVMEALRSVLGRERALSVDDLRMALERTTGQNLEGYFRAWLHGTGAPAWPGITTAYTNNPDGTLSLTVRQQTRDLQNRPCRFTVRLTDGAAQRMEVPITFGLDGSQPAMMTLRPGFTVSAVEVDPTRQALVFPMTMPSGGMWVEHVPTGGRNPFLAP